MQNLRGDKDLLREAGCFVCAASAIRRPDIALSRKRVRSTPAPPVKSSSNRPSKLCFELIRAAAQSNERVVIIVAAGLGARDVSLGRLRHVFEGDATELGGTRLIPFNLAIGNPARVVLDKVLLGLAPDQVSSFWIDRKIRQSVDAPRSLPSSELVLRVVASLKGGIGYLHANPNTIPPAVRVLSIDGKLPADADDPLVSHR